jgi:hypothetical protein
MGSFLKFTVEPRIKMNCRLGTKMVIWKQGAFYPELGKKTLEFDHCINPGPADDRVCINGFNVSPDEGGDFVGLSSGGYYTAAELDAIHTFGLIRYIVKMYEDVLRQKIPWSWESSGNSRPLQVHIRNNGINARYLKSARCIQLDRFGPRQNQTSYCRSVDITAHETGHAILDGLKPQWEKGTVETRGMAETFGDLTAMFVVTSQLDLCEIVLKENQGNFQESSILSLFGAGFGADGHAEAPIRNAINSVKYQDDYAFPYEYGEVLIGALYDILVEMIRYNKRSAICAKDLYSTAKIWQWGIVRAYVSCMPDHSTIKEFRQNLIDVLPDFKEIIQVKFKERCGC